MDPDVFLRELAGRLRSAAPDDGSGAGAFIAALRGQLGGAAPAGAARRGWWSRLSGGDA